jgi:hypothetical protein
MEVGGQRHAPAVLPPGVTRYQFTSSWMGPRAVLDGSGKSRPRGIRFPEARIESLHRLRYVGTHDYTLQKYGRRLIQRHTKVTLFYDSVKFDSYLLSLTCKILVHCFTECGYTFVTGEQQIVHKMKHDIIYWFECYRKPSIIYILRVHFTSLGALLEAHCSVPRSKQNGQCTYKRNIEARSRNHCCCRKAMSITYSECVTVDLASMQSACAIIIYALSGIFYHIFPYDLINGTIFGNTLLNITCFVYRLWNIPHSNKN